MFMGTMVKPSNSYYRTTFSPVNSTGSLKSCLVSICHDFSFDHPRSYPFFVLNLLCTSEGYILSIFATFNDNMLFDIILQILLY